MNNKTGILSTVGRRKESVARVRVMEGNSQITVNGKLISDLYRGPVFQKRYQRPFDITGTLGKLTSTVKVTGGGYSGQLDAIVHGIARGLAQMSEEYKQILRKNGLLTRDPRARERRKYGLARGARAEKQSPKR